MLTMKHWDDNIINVNDRWTGGDESADNKRTGAVYKMWKQFRSLPSKRKTFECIDSKVQVWMQPSILRTKLERGWIIL